jgi:hypothetical protein
MISPEEPATAAETVVIAPVEPFSPERAAAKQAIKLAFISGSATLTQLSVKYMVPYETVARWSKNEHWKEQKGKIATVSEQKLTDNLTDFIAEERVKQVRRALGRAQGLQKLADEAVVNVGKDLSPADVQALASAEERADNIVRRNLGMDQQHGGGSSVSINILAGGVQLS